MNSEENKVFLAYKIFWDGLSTRDLDLRFSVCSEDVTFFGTSMHERAVGKKQYREINERGVKQYPSPYEIQTLWLNIRVFPHIAWIESDTIWIQPVNDKISKEFIRLTTILKKENNNWMVIHVHGSEPDYRMKEGEYEMTADILERNRSLEKQVYERTMELIAQKKIIEEKQKDITASIRYAKRIQNAILTSDEYLADALNQYFVLFKPKDVVSGDFYWAYQTKNKVIYIAADCTGHGVPGAFMSMIGNSILNEIVIEKKITEADKILNELNKAIIKTLGQTGATGEARDGMDIALCVWHKDTNKLEFAGANNPLYLIRKNVANTKLCQNGNVKFFENDLAEIKGDKQPIGYEEGKEEPFTKNEIQLQKDDTIYIFSDGYQDQYGGKMNKKFMARRFRQLFIDMQGKNMQEQKEILDKTIEDWKGDVEQIDDILVIGVRI